MSRKIQAFTNYITTPANTHNYLIRVPELGEYSLVVQSTSLPADSVRTTTLYVQGEEIRYPAVASNAGTWGFDVPDSDDMEVARRLDLLRSRYWDQNTGTVNASALLWEDVDIYLRDLNSQETYQCSLHGCWLVGRSDVRLSQSAPETALQWAYSMRYQWLSNKRIPRG